MCFPIERIVYNSNGNIDVDAQKEVLEQKKTIIVNCIYITTLILGIFLLFSSCYIFNQNIKDSIKNVFIYVGISSSVFISAGFSGLAVSDDFIASDNEYRAFLKKNYLKISLHDLATLHDNELTFEMIENYFERNLNLLNPDNLSHIQEILWVLLGHSKASNFLAIKIMKKLQESKINLNVFHLDRYYPRYSRTNFSIMEIIAYFQPNCFKSRYDDVYYEESDYAYYIQAIKDFKENKLPKPLIDYNRHYQSYIPYILKDMQKKATTTVPTDIPKMITDYL